MGLGGSVGRKVALVALVAVGVALSAAPLADAPAGPGGSAPAPKTVPGPALFDATFDDLPSGPLTAATFAEEFGHVFRESNFTDAAVVSDEGGSGNVLRVTLEAGTYRSGPGGYHGLAVWSPLPTPVDAACLTYDVRFSPGFDWGLGGKLPGLVGVLPGVDPSLPSGGVRPGDKGWSVRGMWVGPDAYHWVHSPNEGLTYLYGPEQESMYGDNLPWGSGFDAGRWHEVTHCVTMNTVGMADGSVQAWVDGDLVASDTSQVWRVRDDVHITQIAWSLFRGGSGMEWAAPVDGYVDLDNVRVREIDRP